MQKNVFIQGLGVPRRIKAARSRKNLTRAELAQRTGLSYRTILELERDNRDRVLEKTLRLIAAELDMTYEELLGRSPLARARWPAPMARRGR